MPWRARRWSSMWAQLSVAVCTCQTADGCGYTARQSEGSTGCWLVHVGASRTRVLFKTSYEPVHGREWCRSVMNSCALLFKKKLMCCAPSFPSMEKCNSNLFAHTNNKEKSHVLPHTTHVLWIRLKQKIVLVSCERNQLNIASYSD